MNGQVIWIMGLSGSGKSTLSDALSKYLKLQGHEKVYHLDGDVLRNGLNDNLGFSQQDRDENLRRAAHVARLFMHEGYLVIASFITPLERQRQMIRELFPGEQYREVWLSTPLSICEQRDPKGLYQKARQGLIAEFTGIDSEFETPKESHLILNTDGISLDDSVQALMSTFKL